MLSECEDYAKEFSLKFEAQSYINYNLLKIDQKCLLFKLRTSMTPVKSNFKSMFDDINCMLCGLGVPQSDLHLLESPKIIENCSKLNDDFETEYLDISADLEHQVQATQIYAAIIETKKK